MANPTNVPSMPFAQPPSGYPYANPYYTVDQYGNPFNVTNPFSVQVGNALGNIVTVAQFHNADNQAPGGTAFGLLTGGVNQLINFLGNLDRQREVGQDGIANLGIATGGAQFKMRFKTTDATDNFAAGTRTFTPAAMSGVLQGVAWSIQPGQLLILDTGGNQETVQVSSITATTFTCVTGKAHNGTVTPFPVVGAVYNEERDVAGELDGATGQGGAVAIAETYNGGGPLSNTNAISSLQFDRVRNLQALGLGAGTLFNNPLAAGSTTLTLNAAPTTLQPGVQVIMDRLGANPETNYVDLNYVVGSTSVPLQNPTAFSHALNSTVEWTQHAVLGPGLNGFLPTGVDIAEEVVYDNVSKKWYLELAGTADANPTQNVPLVHNPKYNGTTFDRERIITKFVQLKAVAVTAGTPVSVYTPTASKKFRILSYHLSLSVAGSVLMEDGTGNEVLRTPLMALGIGQAAPPMGNGILSAAANNQIFIDVTASGSVSGWIGVDGDE